MEEKQLELEPKVFTETRPNLQETIEKLSKMRSTLNDLVVEEPATSEMFRHYPLRKSLYRTLRRYYSDKEKNRLIDERMIEKIRQDLDEFINQDPYHINILNFLPAELICDLYSNPKQKEKFTGYFNQLINTATKKNFALFIKSIPLLIDKGIIPPDQYFFFLQDPDPDVRGAAVEAIPELIDKGIIPPDQYFFFLQDPDPYVREAAVEAIPELIVKGIITKENFHDDILGKILKDPNRDVRGKVAKTAPLLIKEGIMPLTQYYSILQDRDPYDRGKFADAIPLLIVKGIITIENFPDDILGKILKDPIPYVRGSIAEITPLLIKRGRIPLSLYHSFLQDPSPYVRKKFATIIPSLITEGIIPHSQYFTFLQDSDPYVRGAAVKAIPELIEKGIIPPDQYFFFLQDPDPYVREEAVKAIPELIVKGIITNENFSDCILDNILKDSNPYIRREIVKALPILIKRGIIQYPLNNPDLYLPQGLGQNFTPLVLAQAIKETNQKINLVLKEKKLDDKVLPGLLILGSAIKGYWLPSSDIDWGLIVDSTINKDALETAFEELTSSLDAQGISLCHCHVIYVDNLKNGDISKMDLSEEENDAIFNLFIGQWVGNTDIRNLRNLLIRKFLNKHPEEKTKILDHMVDNLVTEGLIDKGIKRRFGKEEVDDTYKKIASLLFVSKIGLPENS